MKKLIILLLAIFLVACNAADERVETIQLQEQNLQVQDNQMIFTLDGDVKQASYSKYVFDLIEFRDEVNDENGQIQIRIVSMTEETFKPDPMSQSPSDGFDIIFYFCEILN